ncbi:MAG: DEAD/DEAH box helicase [Methanosphaera stadtmanae]|nr:DEAD/DEAH box helicase [Methanosphaera stadtmanae]
MIYLDIQKKIVTMYNLGKTKFSHNIKAKVKTKSSFKIKKEHNILKASDYKIILSNITRKEKIDKLFQLLKKEKIIISPYKPLLEQFLTEYDIKYNIQQSCHICKQKNRITFINPKTSHTYNKYKICEDCLDNLILNMLLEYGYSSNSLKIFKKLYEKTGDLNIVYDMIENEYNPIENPELTLYDQYEETEDEFARVDVDNLNIPRAFKNILREKIEYLLPVQIMALNEGLLFNENLLVVSQTASGKTLIAELAGITRALQNRKFVYLSPLVALANQKYRQFKKDYEKLGLKVAIKVGKNRVHADDELTIDDMPIEDADIIVATYEGLDFILRSGQYHMLDNLGVVAIDEIHMLDNVERGCRLNGLIHRLMDLFKHAQLIGLSATINNSRQLAKEFNMTLVEYDKRPVMLERHLVFCESDEYKNRIIEELCRKEYDSLSSKSYKGQTIIFTDSRRKTNMIARNLQKKGINAESYHAGLTYASKVRIEEAFANQKISVVVTTAALAAGVDFPASQVIFDSLRMGKEWLTHNEFHQMLGRAGRPSFHDKGLVYLLPITGNYMFHKLEENVAYDLLESKVDNIHVIYRSSDVYEQVLSDISTVGVCDLEELQTKYSKFSLPIRFNDAVDELFEYDMIEYNYQNKLHNITDYGRATAMSFLTVNEAEFIREHITDNPVDIITSLYPINNAYLSGGLLKSFKRILGHNPSTRLFSDSTKELITDGFFTNQLSRKHQNQLQDLYRDFMMCDCWYSPYCNCLEENVSKHIIKRRLEGHSPYEISKEFMINYSINIYSGDIYNWLDQTIRYSESIGRIALSLDVPNVSSECEKLTKQIEFGDADKNSIEIKKD